MDLDPRKYKRKHRDVVQRTQILTEDVDPVGHNRLGRDVHEVFQIRIRVQVVYSCGSGTKEEKKEGFNAIWLHLRTSII